MKITTEKARVEAPAKEVFLFLSISENIEKLLPQDKISDFSSDDEGCRFKVQGGIEISLLYVELEEHSRIHMKSGQKAPFSYTLTIHLEEGDGHTHGHIAFHGDVNVFLKMMVEKPLLNLFNYMSQRLQEQF